MRKRAGTRSPSRAEGPGGVNPVHRTRRGGMEPEDAAAAAAPTLLKVVEAPEVRDGARWAELLARAAQAPRPAPFRYSPTRPPHGTACKPAGKWPPSSQASIDQRPDGAERAERRPVERVTFHERCTDVAAGAAADLSAAIGVDGPAPRPLRLHQLRLGALGGRGRLGEQTHRRGLPVRIGLTARPAARPGGPPGRAAAVGLCRRTCLSVSPPPRRMHETGITPPGEIERIYSFLGC